MPGGSRARRCTSMEASTSWPDATFVGDPPLPQRHIDRPARASYTGSDWRAKASVGRDSVMTRNPKNSCGTTQLAAEVRLDALADRGDQPLRLDRAHRV